MNPWYRRPGHPTLRKAFTEAIRLTYRWGGQWFIYQDLIDLDFLSIAVEFNPNKRFRLIGICSQRDLLAPARITLRNPPHVH